MAPPKMEWVVDSILAPEVRLSVAGVNDIEVPWPEGWPPPRVGETVSIATATGPRTLTVRYVVWYPQGDPLGDDPSTPHIYVVIGAGL